MKEIAATWKSPSNLSDLVTGGLILDTSLASWIPRNQRAFSRAGNIALVKNFSPRATAATRYTVADFILNPTRILTNNTYAISFASLQSGSGSFFITFFDNNGNASFAPQSPNANPIFISTPQTVILNPNSFGALGMRCLVEYQPVGAARLITLIVREKILVANEL